MFRPEIIDHRHDQEDANRCQADVIPQELEPGDVLSAGRDVG